MNMAKFLKVMLTACFVTACACGLAACGNSASGGGTAATVNGVAISEDEVTNTIQNLRAQSNLEDEESWGTFLVSNEMTPQSVREQTINSFVDQELVKEGASQLGIAIDSTEIDTYVASMRANFDSDEAWNQALSQAGFTEDEYRKNIETSLMQQEINKHFQDEAKVEESDIDDAAKTYASVYDGSKRSSHILIGVDDKNDEKALKEAREKAADLKKRIESGEISFEDAAKENSTDTGSAQKGGDVGWDALNSFVTEYTDALDELDKDEISDPVESQYGIHIIKVTDVYEAPEEVKGMKDLPEDFRSTIEEYAKSIKANTAYSDWLEGLRSNADITINDMPEKVPYNIDLTSYEAAAASEDAEGDDGETIELDGEDGELIELDGEEEAASEGSEDAASDSASSASTSSEAASEASEGSASAESASSESASSASASSESANS